MHHLEQGNRKKGAFRRLTVFASAGPAGILQEKLAERGVMLYNETCAEGFHIFK